MPENLVVAPAGSGVQVGADEVTLKGVPQVLVQYVKILDGTNDSVVPIATDQSSDANPAGLLVTLGGYGATVRCRSLTVTTTPVALSTLLGSVMAKRKNLMIMNIGGVGVALGDASIQAWPLDPYVPFVQDWGPSVDPSIRALTGTSTVVTLETA